MSASNNLPSFIELAAALTGVSPKIVGQAQDAANYFESYTSLVNSNGRPNAMDALMQVYGMNRLKYPPAVVAAMLLDGGLDNGSPYPPFMFSDMTRNLMKLLLLGVWFEPTKSKDPDYFGEIPTSAAYSESMVWLIGQAHPVGDSKMAYGHWANPPPPLKGLIG